LPPEAIVLGRTVVAASAGAVLRVQGKRHAAGRERASRK
jgi:hypothetical protein